MGCLRKRSASFSNLTLSKGVVAFYVIHIPYNKKMEIFFFPVSKSEWKFSRQQVKQYSIDTFHTFNYVKRKQVQVNLNLSVMI